MNRNVLRYIFPVLSALFLLLILYSCANMASPGGGPYDEDPPRFISSTPAPDQTNYTGKKIEILFDELIQIENPMENVIITPPQQQLPIVRALGKKVSVELKDTLKENTTYTIDFTNSIADNNEKNVLENFSFAFSTGDVIDSLQVSGILLNARDLEPVPSITIGLHSNLEDSAFTKEIFIRTSRTNDRGEFTIRNISPGTYRLYALNDVNRDYKFDQPGEDIAFLDSVITPSFEFSLRNDTIWQDSLTIDTIYTVQYTRFTPNNIILRLFQEEFARQYMTRPERQEAHRFTLRFNVAPDTIPEPIPLNFTSNKDPWYVAQPIEDGSSINYWLTDSLVWQKDTLQIEITYLNSDSANILRPQTDTLSIGMRPQRGESRSRKKKDEEEEIIFLRMDINATGSKDLKDTISITFDEPVLNLDPEVFVLTQKSDTVWIPVEDFEFFPNPSNTLGFLLTRTWKYGEEYKLEVDSAAIFSIYDKWNEAYKGEFKIKERDEYGHLYINIYGVEAPAFVELLNTGDAVVRREKVKDGGVLFMNLQPDTYYARIVIDLNENGEWDTGNYEKKLQPEEVYYYTKPLKVNQNWEVEESWQVNAEPLNKQKPLDILKNKPKEAVQRNRNNERR